MKITQDTQTYLECKKSALVGYIVSGLLMLGGVAAVIIMLLQSASQWWLGLIALRRLALCPCTNIRYLKWLLQLLHATGALKTTMIKTT